MARKSQLEIENNHILRKTSGEIKIKNGLKCIIGEEPGPGGHYFFTNNALAGILILIFNIYVYCHFKNKNTFPNIYVHCHASFFSKV